RGGTAAERAREANAHILAVDVGIARGQGHDRPPLLTVPLGLSRSLRGSVCVRRDFVRRVAPSSRPDRSGVIQEQRPGTGPALTTRGADDYRSSSGST